MARLDRQVIQFEPCDSANDVGLGLLAHEKSSAGVHILVSLLQNAGWFHIDDCGRALLDLNLLVLVVYLVHKAQSGVAFDFKQLILLAARFGGFRSLRVPLVAYLSLAGARFSARPISLV